MKHVRVYENEQPKYWHTYSQLINLTVQYETEIQEHLGANAPAEVRTKLAQAKGLMAEVERILEKL